MADTAASDEPDTRARLIVAAASLFRDKGFHGTALTEVLVRAGASKSSLFHHFPAGKDDLALAAARWADAGTLRIIDDAFGDVPNFRAGCDVFCRKLAKYMEREPSWAGCPVTQILFRDAGAGAGADAFRAETSRILDGWRDRVAAHGARLGLLHVEAADRAETLLIAVQGAWALARARRDAGVLRDLVQRLPM